MSIEIPPALAWAASLAVGQEWPQGDEDKLLALGAAWEEVARELEALGPELEPITAGVLASVTGPTAEQFQSFTGQFLVNLRQMAQSAEQLAQLARTTGVEVEYAKYMILVQLVWMASEIAQWALLAPEVVPAVVTAGRLAVQMILRRLLVSILAGVVTMVGLDAAVQALQFLKGDRTQWDVQNTLRAAESGAIGGAIGGFFFGGGAVFAPKYAESLLGRLALGATTGAVTTVAMGGIDGSGIAGAFTSGALSALGGEGRRFRWRERGGGDVELDGLAPPDLPDLAAAERAAGLQDGEPVRPLRPARLSVDAPLSEAPPTSNLTRQAPDPHPTADGLPGFETTLTADDHSTSSAGDATPERPEPLRRDSLSVADSATGRGAGRVTLADLFAREDQSATHSREPVVHEPAVHEPVVHEPAPLARVAAGADAPVPSAHAGRHWFMERDALGEVSVVRVEEPHTGVAAQWANRMAYETARPGDSERLRAAIRDGIRRLLLHQADSGSGPVGPAGTSHRSTESERALANAEKALQQGHLTEEDGHVVWLRPVLRDITPAPEREPEPDGAVEYKVGYGKLVSGDTSESVTSSGADSTLQTLLSTPSAAASTVVPVVPVLGLELARSRATEVERDMTVGRRLFSTEYTRLQAGVHIRVFVDGVERPHDVVTAQRVEVDVPARRAHPEPPPRGMDASAMREVTAGAPHHAREVVNAVDLIPMTAALQRHLLEAGLPAHGVRAVMSQVLPRLNERSVLHRSRYWLTNGVVSERVRFPAGAVKSFEGHVFMRAAIERLQYIGHAPGAAVREDTSGGTTTGHTQGGRNRASLGVALFTSGVHQQAAFLPTASLTVGSRRDARHGLSEGAENHTVLTATSDQARYRAQLRLTVEVRSITHKVAPFSHVVESEIGVSDRDAADFERRLLGDGPPPPRPAPLAADGPAEASPRARALPQADGAAVPESASQRPARLDGPSPVPHPREPLALASRRGQGFGAQMALPGAELAHEQIRGALERWHRRFTRNATADWSRTDHDLLTWFGRPALEADLSRLLSGVHHTVRLGGRSYDVSVKAHLLDRIGGPSGADAYPMKVNVRSQQTAKVTGRLDKRWNVRAVAGLSVQVKARSWLVAQLGTVSGSVGAGEEFRHTFSGGSRSYQRTQAAGPVDEHVYDIVYEIGVGSPGHPTERWWVDRPGDIVARVVVPHQHVPARPLSVGELAAAGTVSTSPAPPDEPSADFRGGGTAGVFPAFLSVPELAETAARLYQQANGFPADWHTDQANWPAELKTVTDPVHLGAEFGALSSATGKTTELPVGKDGWKQALRLRVTAVQPRHVVAHSGEGRTVEVQHYTQGQAYFKKTAWSVREAGLQAAFGPRFQIGHGQQSGASGWNPTGAGGGGDRHAVHAQILATGSAELLWERTTGSAVEEGPLGNSRASYQGTVHTYRADPVFEITLHRWKGAGLASPSGAATRHTEYLRVTAGMDFLIPERRIPDLGLPVPRGMDHTKPQEPTGYVHPAMVPGVSHPEVLHADAVLDRIKQWLTSQGVLHSAGGGTGAPAEVRPSLLLRELERSYSSHALLNQFALLTGAGVTRWLPLPWAFGATRYLWTNVAAKIGPPMAQRSRPEVRLMTRAQAHLETTRREADYRTATVSAQLRTRAGTWAHAGLELGAGHTRTSGHGTEHVEREMEIERAITEEGSQEFTHPLTLHVRMGITMKPPEVLSAPGRGLRTAVLGLADRLGHGREAADWWYRHQPFAKQFPSPRHPGDGAVPGRVRLLVPGHLVVDGPPPPAAAPASTVAWEPRPPGPDTPPRPSGDQELLGRLLQDGHPWALPAATTINRWASLAAAPFRPPHDLTAADAWHVPGLDPTTLSGLRYAHMTSENLLRASIDRLLRHQYQVPVADRTVTVGLDITAVRPLGPQDGAMFTARHHKLMEEASKSTYERTHGWYTEAGPEVGAELSNGASALEQAPFTRGTEHTVESDRETAEVEEPDQERSRRYRHYSADVDLTIAGPRGRLRVHIPDGLYFMLPSG